MAGLLSDIKAYLVGNSLIASSSIFEDSMPDSPDFVAALYEYQGTAPLPQIAGYSRSVQVVVRSKSYAQAKAKCDQFFEALNTEDGILYLTPDRWTLTILLQAPFKMKVDAGNRVYVCFNASITTYL